MYRRAGNTRRLIHVCDIHHSNTDIQVMLDDVQRPLESAILANTPHTYAHAPLPQGSLRLAKCVCIL